MMSEPSSASPAFYIRLLKSIDEYHTMEQLQQVVWQLPDPLEVVPLHLLLTAQKNGGLAAGAFDKTTDEMIGFVFSFLGVTSTKRLKHCSHLAGVIPPWRRQNIAYALKVFQRSYVQQQGLDLITWTYDPLESVNAVLNITKLGGIVRSYYRHLYGDLGGLNKNIPTDRFEVEWWINSPRVVAYLAPDRPHDTVAAKLAKGAVSVLETSVEAGDVLHFGQVDLNQQASSLLLEFPANYQAMKQYSLDHARAWRLITREVLENYFKRGYYISDVLSEQTAVGLRRAYYMLQWGELDIPPA